LIFIASDNDNTAPNVNMPAPLLEYSKEAKGLWSDFCGQRAWELRIFTEEWQFSKVTAV